MKKFFKFILKTLSFFLTVVLFFFNYSLYYNPTFTENENGTYNEDVYHQLQFLKEELHQKHYKGSYWEKGEIKLR